MKTCLCISACVAVPNEYLSVPPDGTMPDDSQCLWREDECHVVIWPFSIFCPPQVTPTYTVIQNFRCLPGKTI